MNDEFYIGWEEKAPARTGRRVRFVVVSTVLLAAGLALGVAANQRLIGKASFDWDTEQTFTGTLHLSPVPSLDVSPTPNGVARAHLLVAPWKHGFEADAARPFDGRRVALSGKLIRRDGGQMIEVSPGSLKAVEGPQSALTPPSVRSLGRVTLTGEIVDSKCWLGVMNPGRLATHRACAVRCISGGVPPMLLVQYEGGRTENYLLVGADGRMLNREILDYVAEPVAIAGEVLQQGDLFFLKAEPRDVARLGSAR